jgi:hypothetical protein
LLLLEFYGFGFVGNLCFNTDLIRKKALKNRLIMVKQSRLKKYVFYSIRPLKRSHKETSGFILTEPEGGKESNFFIQSDKVRIKSKMLCLARG